MLNILSRRVVVLYEMLVFLLGALENTAHHLGYAVLNVFFCMARYIDTCREMYWDRHE